MQKHLKSNKAKFILPSIHSKITRHAKNQESRIHKNKKKNQWGHADDRISKQGHYMVIITVLHMFKKLEESLNMLRHRRYKKD